MTIFARVLALLTLLASPAYAAETVSVVAVTSDGLARNILFVAPPSPPVAAVVMFPGGDGRIDIAPNGSIARQGNFLIRTRARWVSRGFLFVAVDAIQGSTGFRGDRVGMANQRSIAEIVKTVRQRTKAPIWLLGTSAGAPAAIAGAASLPAGSIRGVVISSPVSTQGRHDSVFDAPLSQVSVPVLIQIHRDDACRVTPPANAHRIRAELKAARLSEVQVFTGGDTPRSPPCEAFAQHGFLGIEDSVVDAAAAWIVSH